MFGFVISITKLIHGTQEEMRKKILQLQINALLQFKNNILPKKTIMWYPKFCLIYNLCFTSINVQMCKGALASLAHNIEGFPRIMLCLASFSMLITCHILWVYSTYAHETHTNANAFFQIKIIRIIFMCAVWYLCAVVWESVR